MERKSYQNIIFAGHLEEVNDLKKWRRDAPLDSDDPNNKEALAKIVDAIFEKIKINNRKAVLFISSSKLRSQQTSELIAQELKNKLGNSVKFRFSTESNLDGNNQGDFVLPDDYVAGQVFEGLKIAGKIYNTEFSVNKNLNYKFGDPVVLENGTYKYPELLPFFSKSGESYKEPLVRMFNSVLDMSQKVEKLNQNTEVVVTAHGLTYYVLNGLSLIADDLLKGKHVFKKGELAFIIWDKYLKRAEELKDRAYGFIDISNLDNPDLIAKLKEEIDYLNDN